MAVRIIMWYYLQLSTVLCKTKRNSVGGVAGLLTNGSADGHLTNGSAPPLTLQRAKEA